MGVANNNHNGLSKMFYVTHSNLLITLEMLYVSFNTPRDVENFFEKMKQSFTFKS